MDDEANGQPTNLNRQTPNPKTPQLHNQPLYPLPQRPPQPLLSSTLLQQSPPPRRAHTQRLKQLLFDERLIDRNLRLLFQPVKNFRKGRGLELDKPIGQLMERIRLLDEKEGGDRLKLTQQDRIRILKEALKGKDLYQELANSKMFVEGNSGESSITTQQNISQNIEHQDTTHIQSQNPKAKPKTLQQARMKNPELGFSAITFHSQLE